MHIGSIRATLPTVLLNLDLETTLPCESNGGRARSQKASTVGTVVKDNKDATSTMTVWVVLTDQVVASDIRQK
eukprot:2737441-Amphidinium_carterae.1